jgi:hypothetical protein
VAIVRGVGGHPPCRCRIPRRMVHPGRAYRPVLKNGFMRSGRRFMSTTTHHEKVGHVKPDAFGSKLLLQSRITHPQSASADLLHHQISYHSVYQIRRSTESITHLQVQSTARLSAYVYNCQPQPVVVKFLIQMCCSAFELFAINLILLGSDGKE